MGPRLNAGKNVKAPTMTITLTSRAVNKGVVTGNVPGEGGTAFLRARLPATANMGTIIKKRPVNMVNPMARLYQRFPPSPANAEPLLPVPEVKAYRISERPCGPLFVRVARPCGRSDDAAASTRIIRGKMST